MSITRIFLDTILNYSGTVLLVLDEMGKYKRIHCPPKHPLYEYYHSLKGKSIETPENREIFKAFIMSESEEKQFHYTAHMGNEDKLFEAHLFRYKSSYFSHTKILWVEKQIEKHHSHNEHDSRIINILLKSRYQMFVVINTDMNIITFNHAFEEFIKEQRGRVVNEGDDYLGCLPPHKAAFYTENIYKVIKTGRQLSFETQSENQEDSDYFQVIIDPIASDSGDVEKVSITSFNISDLKNAKKHLYEERERLSATLKSIGEGVIVTDTDGKIIYFNTTAAKITGYQDTEAVSKQIDAILNITDAGTIPDQDQINTHSSTLRRKDGKDIYIEYTKNDIQDNKGNLLGRIAVFKDITDKIKLENEIIKNSKLDSLGVLAGGLAHDYNNLLTAVLGNITLCKMYTRDTAMLETLNQAEKAAEKAAELTQKLITFAKGGSPIKSSIDFKSFLRETVDFYLAGSNIKPHFSIAEEIDTITGDRSQLGLAVSNIIINAQQAMPDGGEIIIRARYVNSTDEKQLKEREGQFIKIEFVDRGCGIDPKSLPKIFDPYFTTKQNAMGLGLSSAYSIIMKHCGAIFADNLEGKGAVITVYLPANAAIADNQQDRPKKQQNIHKKILVMDDDPIIRVTIKAMLDQLSCETITAEEGEKAVRLYQAERENGKPFDLVLLDLTVPGGMGGKQTIVKLKEYDHNVKAVVTSGYYDDPVMASWEEYGFVGVLKKPYTLETLSLFLRGLPQ